MDAALAGVKFPAAVLAERGRFARRVSAVFGALALMIVFAGTGAYRIAESITGDFGWVAHTLEVKAELASAEADARAAEAALARYLLGGNADSLGGYYDGSHGAALHVDRVRALVADNTSQSDNARALGALMQTRQRELDGLVRAGPDKPGAPARVAPAIERLHALDGSIDALDATMVAAEDALLLARRARASGSATLARRLSVAADAIGLAGLGVALFLVLREQRQRTASQTLLRQSYSELAKSLEESRRLADTMQQMSDLGEMMQTCQSIGEAADGMRSALATLLPGCAGTINLTSASHDLVETLTSWGEHTFETSSLFAPDDCWALRRGQAFPPAEGFTTFRCKHVVLPVDDASDAAYLCVPLMAQGEILGTLHLTSAHAIDEVNRRTALAAAEQISLSLGNLRLQETLRTQSLRDPLTGLFNRRYLEASLDRELLRAGRRNLALSVLMIDIDHFKRFNDSHGHEAGDALLAKFGALLARSVRSEDIACRYGGEEFTVIMLEADAAQASARAEAIRTTVAGMEVEHRRRQLGRVTVSIGVATYPSGGTVPDELLRHADRALYDAKHGGRDRVHVAA